MSAIYILMTTTSVKSVVPLSSSDERCYVRAKDYCYYFCLLSSRLQGVLLVTFMRPSSQPAAPSRGAPWYFKSFRWCWLDAEQETLGCKLFVLKEVEVVAAFVQSSGIKAFPKVDFNGLTSQPRHVWWLLCFHCFWTSSDVRLLGTILLLSFVIYEFAFRFNQHTWGASSVGTWEKIFPGFWYTLLSQFLFYSNSQQNLFLIKQWHRLTF